MLKERLEAAVAVRDVYMPLKIKANEVAVAASRCAFVMLEMREQAGLGVGAGAQAHADIMQGAAMVAAGYAKIAGAHPELGQLLRDAGLERVYPYRVAWGPGETPPNEPGTGQEPSGHLKVVG